LRRVTELTGFNVLDSFDMPANFAPAVAESANRYRELSSLYSANEHDKVIKLVDSTMEEYPAAWPCFSSLLIVKADSESGLEHRTWPVTSAKALLGAAILGRSVAGSHALTASGVVYPVIACAALYQLSWMDGTGTADSDLFVRLSY